MKDIPVFGGGYNGKKEINRVAFMGNPKAPAEKKAKEKVEKKETKPKTSRSKTKAKQVKKRLEKKED